jgi:hypothetical protein
VRRSELSERMFYKLMGRIFGDGMEVLPESVMRGFTEVFTRFQAAFGKALPELSAEELLWRIHFTAGVMIHTMAHGETLHRFSEGASGEPSMESTLSRFVRFAAAGMRQQAGVARGEAEPKKSGGQEEFLF